jgi:hypothetical protein
VSNLSQDISLNGTGCIIQSFPTQSRLSAALSLRIFVVHALHVLLVSVADVFNPTGLPSLQLVVREQFALGVEVESLLGRILLRLLRLTMDGAALWVARGALGRAPGLGSFTVVRRGVGRAAEAFGLEVGVGRHGYL